MRHTFKGSTRTWLALGTLSALLASACSPGAQVTAPGASTAPTTAPSASAQPTTPSAAPSLAASATPSPALPAASLGGLVVDINRDPLPGASLKVMRGDALVAEAVTGPDGRYTIGLPEGSYVVSATKAGYLTRAQSVEVKGPTTLHFGPEFSDSVNPYWLADTPEIEAVEVKEAAPGGPLALRLRFSEPLPEASRPGVSDNFEFMAGTSLEFLRVTSSTAVRRRVETGWEEDGRVFVFKYDGPYLASGEADVRYTVRLRQDDLETKDPETQEFELEDLKITDAAGNPLGRGKMAYAFKKPRLFEPSTEQLTDRQFGYLVQDRRWNLSHDGTFSFTAARDTTKPGLKRVVMNVDETDGSQGSDILTLYFDEPMNAARSRDELEWTRLDKDKPMVFLSVSDKPTGSEFRPIDENIKIRKIEFDLNDASIVHVHYPAGTFVDEERVDVTLTSEARDPAGNGPDPKRGHLVGPVVI